MRDELQFVMKFAQELPPADLPNFLGELEVVRYTAMARLMRPDAAQSRDARMLNIAQASQVLGMSKDYLYRNWRDLPFARQIGRRLLFSSAGIDRYIREDGRLAMRRR